MKVLRTVATLIIPLLLTPFALSQADQKQAVPPTVAAARCQYSETDNNCITSAQAPRRFPGPRHPSACCPGPRPGVAYAPAPVSSARHVVVGALVGFTVGGIVPANGSARTRLSVGLVGGLFGALIGASIPAYPSYHRQRNRWPDEDDEDDDLAQHQAPGPSPAHSQPKPPQVALRSQVSSPLAPLVSEPQPPVPASDR